MGYKKKLDNPKGFLSESCGFQNGETSRPSSSEMSACQQLIA